MRRKPEMQMRKRIALVVFAAAAAAFGLISAAAVAQEHVQPPAYWVANEGQFGPDVLFRSEGARETIWLREGEIWLSVSGGGGIRPSGPGERESSTPGVQNIRITFPGALAMTGPVAGRPLDLNRSFLTPGGVFEEVPTWGEIRFTEIAPGVDLRLSAGGGGIEFVLEGDGSPGSVELLIEGADGLSVVDSRLLIRTAFGARVLPFASIEPGLEVIAAAADGATVGFRPAEAPVIDAAATLAPEAGEVVYGTYFGVAGLLEFGSETEIDSDGNAYIAGSSETPLVFEPEPGLQVPDHLVSAFVIKLSPDGSTLEYLTTISGALQGDEDFAFDVALDLQQNAYVTGLTSSSDFPTTPGAFDETHNGGNDAWLVKLNPTGGVLFSTVIGSLGNDWANGVDLGLFGEIYITGFTNGPGFPKTTASYDPSHNGGFDAFIAKFTNDGTTLAAGTFIGGTGDEGGDVNFDRSDIRVDGVGSAVITGPTQSANYPVTGPKIGTGGCKDVFITKISPALSHLYYSARIGGSGATCGFSGDDNAERLDVAADGRVFVTGFTTSGAGSGFPISAGAFDTTYGGSYDAFLLVFNPQTFSVPYATYLGGANVDAGKDIAVDDAGRAYLTGYTYSGGFPTTANGFDLTLSGGLDAFVTKLNPGGAGAADLVYSTFLGGGLADQGVGMKLFGRDILYLTGLAEAGFPVTAGSYQEQNSGDRDAFAALFHLVDPQPPPDPSPTWTPAPINLHAPIVFDDY